MCVRLLRITGMGDVHVQVYGLMAQTLHIPVPNCIGLLGTNVEVHVGFGHRDEKDGRKID